MRSDVRFSGFPLQEWRLSIFWHFKTISSLLGVITEGSNCHLRKCKLTCEDLSTTRQFPDSEVSTLKEEVFHFIQDKDKAVPACEDQVHWGR